MNTSILIAYLSIICSVVEKRYHRQLSFRNSFPQYSCYVLHQQRYDITIWSQQEKVLFHRVDIIASQRPSSESSLVFTCFCFEQIYLWNDHIGGEALVIHWKIEYLTTTLRSLYLDNEEYSVEFKHPHRLVSKQIQVKHLVSVLEDEMNQMGRRNSLHNSSAVREW